MFRIKIKMIFHKRGMLFKIQRRNKIKSQNFDQRHVQKFFSQITSQKMFKEIFSQNHRSFQKESHFGYQTRYQNCFHQRSQQTFSQTSFSKPNNVAKKKAPFKPNDPPISNPDSRNKFKVLFVKGKNEMKNFNH